MITVTTDRGACRAAVECDCHDGWRYGAAAARCANPAHRFAALINAARVPGDLAAALRGEFDIEGQRAEIVARVPQMLCGDLRGLIMSGAPDTGKSHAAAYLAALMMQAGRGVVWATAHDLVEAAKAGYGRRQSVAASLDRYAAAPVLVLDELRAHSPHDREIIGRVIRARYERSAGALALTIITANGAADDIASALDGHIWSRLRSIAPVYTMRGRSRRGVAS